MLKAPGDEGAQQMRDLIEDIIHFGNISTEWEVCIIVSLYKDINGGLKLLNQIMKVLERVAENFIWQQMCIDDMQLCGLASSLDAAQTPYWLCQLQEKFYVVRKTLCMAFVDLEKTQPSYRNAWSGLLSAIRL